MPTKMGNWVGRIPKGNRKINFALQSHGKINFALQSHGKINHVG